MIEDHIGDHFDSAAMGSLDQGFEIRFRSQPINLAVVHGLVPARPGIHGSRWVRIDGAGVGLLRR